MIKEIKTIEPSDVMEKMEVAEFLQYSKYGYNYVLFDSPKDIEVKKGMVINLNGEYFKVGTNLEDILTDLSTMSVDDMRKFLMNEFARIGVTLTFISMGEHNKLEKLDENGKPVSKIKLKKELEKELKAVNNTATVLRALISRHYKELEINIEERVTIQAKKDE